MKLITVKQQQSSDIEMAQCSKDSVSPFEIIRECLFFILFLITFVTVGRNYSEDEYEKMETICLRGHDLLLFFIKEHVSCLFVTHTRTL
jgi:hypothetical protein